MASPNAAPPRGFPRWAWWTLFLATFMFVVPLSSPWWSTLLRREIPDAEADEEGETPMVEATPADADSVVPGSMLKVSLHTRLVGQPGLSVVEREVPYVRGIVPQIRAAVSELAVASADAPALLPAGTRVVEVVYSQGGTVYIDFSSELEVSRGVGAEEERVVIQGIVRTITANFAAVRRVQILVDGKAPKPGHYDLSRALRRDDPILASDDEPEALASPSPSPSVPPASPARAPLPSPSLANSPKPLTSPRAAGSYGLALPPQGRNIPS